MKQQRFPKVNLKNLSHEQIRTVLQRIVTQWEGSATIPVTIKLLLKDIIDQLLILDKILLREQSSAQTKEIRLVDELRDRAYKLLVNKVENSQDEFEEHLLEAGAALLPITEKFGKDLTKRSYAEETTLMNLAISEFRDSAMESHLIALNLMTDLERVETYESKFETIWGERSAVESAKEDLPRMKTVRSELKKKGTLLLETSEYLYEKNHSSIDDSLFNIISDELSKAGATVKLRETIAENTEVGA